MKIAILGECMVELSQQADGRFNMGFGGDTLNTAVYLARNGGQCDYFTALGEDEYSQNMMLNWAEEGIGTKQIKVYKDCLPGLYVIKNDDDGERHFHYWRQNAPVKQLLSRSPEVFQELQRYPLVFLTGITLSLFNDEDRELLYSFLSGYRENGGIVAFDNNFRPKNWRSMNHALNNYKRMMSCTDIALLSFDDELELYGEHTVVDCIARWQNSGANEVIVKRGAEGCVVASNDSIEAIHQEHVVKPVDTTSAGDSFNGAYLANKLNNKSIQECVKAANFCASVVVMHKGAIVPREINLVLGHQ